MKYCGHYNAKNFHNKDFDEWIFNYAEDNPHLIMKFKQLKEENCNKRIIIDISDFCGEPNWEIISAAVREYPQSAVLITKEQIDFIPRIRIYKLDWFFANGCSSWDMLKECADYGVSDVYIINELGFDIKNVKAFCEKNNIKVRIYPNIAQNSTLLLTIGTYTSFFVRPEDISIYEEYVDVFEFFGAPEKEGVLYEIYTEGEWRSDLELLILNIPTLVDNRTKNNYIADVFGTSRLDCKKKCIYGECNICKNCVDAAKAIKARRIEEITQDKEKE